MARILYITYDGVLEPLGQSQVLSYLERLASNHEIFLISFEKEKDRKNTARMLLFHTRFKDAGIIWWPLAYHKSPTALATVFDILIGLTLAVYLARVRRIDIVHARSYVPALIALSVKRIIGTRFLFDIRGFWADERVDGGLWPKSGFLYRVTKLLEQKFFRAADHVVTLTHASVKVIENFEFLQKNRPSVTVVPTCADLDRFRLTTGRKSDQFIFGYVGSIGTWYLFDETVQFFKILLERRPDARFLVVNRNEHSAVRATFGKSGIDPCRLELIDSDHCDVPKHISRMHAASVLIRPCFSKVASAPTKLAEYLGCGVPCLGSKGVGDVQEILEVHRVGVVVPSFDELALRVALDSLLLLVDEHDIAHRCRVTAEQLFALDQGVKKYRQIYDCLGSPSTTVKLDG
jgi:glycosyltransferase involved in cell wall biosynthesis